MRSYITAITSLLVSLSIFGQFTSEELNYLYYSNDNSQITRLYFLDEEKSIAIKEGRKLALLKEGLIRNEIDISEYTTQTWESVVNVNAFNDSSVMLVTRQNIFYLTIKDSIAIDSIANLGGYLLASLQNRVIERDPLSISQNYCLMGRHMGIDFGQVAIPGGYNQSKSDYPPSFWILDSSNFQVINPEREPNSSKDRFRESWYHWPCRFNRDYSLKNDSIIFISVKANKLYIYDLGDGTASQVKLPDIDKSKSWYYYYDHVANRDFYVNKVSKKEFNVYQVTDQYRDITKLASLDYQPTDILNGKIYRRRLRKDGKNRIVDHFLIPLYSSDNMEKKILDNVKVESEK